MKNASFVFFISVLMFSVMPLNASGASDVCNKVSKAIEAGNARGVSQFFGTHVDLTLPGSDGTFSKNQAELILRDFFTKNAPRSFTVSHQGSSRDGSQYVIGQYVSRNNTSYRTYFLVKKVSGKMVLHQIQFENR